MLTIGILLVGLVLGGTLGVNGSESVVGDRGSAMAPAPGAPPTAAQMSARDRAALARLTEFRHQHRKTIDGRLCAAAFVQDDKTFTDCTDLRNPIGISGRPWCYVEVQLLGKGPKDWNYCTPAVNYDVIRTRVQEGLRIKTSEADKMRARLEGARRRVEDMLSRYTVACGPAHADTSSRINSAQEGISKSARALAKMEYVMTKIRLLTDTVTQLEATMATDFKQNLARPENCSTIKGYEDLPLADGLAGSYYGNCLFKGAPALERHDKVLNFSWFGVAPSQELSAEKYSLRWNGYLGAPFSGVYTFGIECDGGSRLWINGSLIVADRMPLPGVGEEPVVKLMNVAESRDVKFTESRPIELRGGQRYKIRVEYLHSATLKHEDPTTGIFKLSWSGPSIPRQSIDAKYLYSLNPTEPIKVSGLDANVFDLFYMNDGEPAIRNKNELLLSDIPLKMVGRRGIRMVSPLPVKKFSFRINIPGNIYVTCKCGTNLPWASSDASPWLASKIPGMLSACPSTVGPECESWYLYLIKVYRPGPVEFVVNDPKVPAVLFLEPLIMESSVCVGEKAVLSLPGTPLFASCDASSQLSHYYSCEAGFSGKHMDDKYGVWRTTGGGAAGEWISIEFVKTVEISQLRFKPRDDSTTWPSVLRLVYSDLNPEDSITVNLLYTNDLDQGSYPIDPPIRANKVKIVIEQTFAACDETGGSVELIGTECVQSRDDDAPPPRIKVQTCNQALGDLFKNEVDLDHDLVVECPSRCLQAPQGRIYGYSTYSIESSICMAGIHAGFCPNTKQDCDFTLSLSGPRTTFPAKLSNGIPSQSHGPADISITLSKPPCVPKPIVEFTAMTINLGLKQFWRSDNSSWYLDKGEIKALHGNFVFGWLRPVDMVVCEDQGPSQVFVSQGAIFPPHPENPICITDPHGCEKNFWSISLPANGKYRVTVEVGHRCFPMKEGEHLYQFLQVNGNPVVDGVKLRRGEYYSGVIDVVVEGKLLVLSADCQSRDDLPADVCRDARTILLGLELRRVGDEESDGDEAEEGDSEAAPLHDEF